MSLWWEETWRKILKEGAKEEGEGSVKISSGNPERWLNHSIDFPSMESLSPSYFSSSLQKGAFGFSSSMEKVSGVRCEKEGEGGGGRGSKGGTESSYALWTEVSITMDNRIPSARAFFFFFSSFKQENRSKRFIKTTTCRVSLLHPQTYEYKILRIRIVPRLINIRKIFLDRSSPAPIIYIP